jgi:hypothetical protein
MLALLIFALLLAVSSEVALARQRNATQWTAILALLIYGRSTNTTLPLLTLLCLAPRCLIYIWPGRLGDALYA